jgi:hypothetical protein
MVIEVHGLLDHEMQISKVATLDPITRTHCPVE